MSLTAPNLRRRWRDGRAADADRGETLLPGGGSAGVALAAACATLALARRARADLALPPGGAIAFRILRDGVEVGTHRIDFARRGDTTIAHVAIDIAVSYAWITVYRFAHRATETWHGAHFAGIESRTDDNGTAAWMRTATDPAGDLLVSGSGTEPYAAPPGALAVHLLESGHPVGAAGDQFAGRPFERTARAAGAWRQCPAWAARCRPAAMRCAANAIWRSGTTSTINGRICASSAADR